MQREGYHRPEPRHIHLTARERQILLMRACGMRVPEIAGELVIERCTVWVHVRNIHERLQAHSITHALAIAIVQLIITHEELAEALEKRRT